MKDCFWGFIYLRSCQINLWGPAIAAHRNKVYPPAAYIQCSGNYNSVTPNVSYDFDTNQGHITFAFPVNLRNRLFDSKYRYISATGRVSNLLTFMYKSCECWKLPETSVYISQYAFIWAQMILIWSLSEAKALMEAMEGGAQHSPVGDFFWRRIAPIWYAFTDSWWYVD